MTAHVHAWQPTIAPDYVCTEAGCGAVARRGRHGGGIRVVARDAAEAELHDRTYSMLARTALAEAEGWRRDEGRQGDRSPAVDEHLAGAREEDRRMPTTRHAWDDRDEAALRAEDGRRSVVLSLRAYGTGFDGLQWAFSRALMSCPVASGDAWEQGICRLFRIGQEADEVIYEVPRHTPEAAQAVDRATARAKYVEGVTSGHQALLAAGVEWRLDPAAARAGEDDPEELAA